jgi:hypothetical protein
MARGIVGKKPSVKRPVKQPAVKQPAVKRVVKPKVVKKVVDLGPKVEIFTGEVATGEITKDTVDTPFELSNDVDMVWERIWQSPYTAGYTYKCTFKIGNALEDSTWKIRVQTDWDNHDITKEVKTNQTVPWTIFTNSEGPTTVTIHIYGTDTATQQGAKGQLSVEYS